MSNFGLPEYDQHREWIRNARNRNMKWEEIMRGVVMMKDYQNS